MGLVGQTRRDDDRVATYDELSVTLKGTTNRYRWTRDR